MQINDLLLALSSSANVEGTQKREKGKTYKLTGTKTCKSCNATFLNIENNKTKNLIGVCRCGQHFVTDYRQWTHISHFASIKSIKENKENLINEFLKKEEYEKCSTIRDFEAI